MKASRVVKIFLQTMFLIAGTLIIGFGSHLLINKLFAREDNQLIALANRDQYKSVDNLVDTNLITAIYSVDSESNKVNHILLEVMNTNKSKLSYISIPVSSKLTISDELYRELSSIKPTFPQVLTLSEGAICYGNLVGLTFVDRIISEILGKNVNFSIAFPIDTFQSYFLTKENETYSTIGFAKPFVTRLNNLRGNSVYDELVEAFHLSSMYSFKEEEKLAYLETYDSINLNDINFYEAPGVVTNSGFSIDEDNLKILLYQAIY